MEDTRETAALKLHFPVFARAALIYAAFYTFCLYKNPSGITYPLSVAGMLVYFRYCFQKLNICRKKGTRFYEICLLLLGISVCLTDSSGLNSITRNGILMLTLIYLLHAVYEDREWDFLKYMTAALQTLANAVSSVAAPFCYAGIYSREPDRDTGYPNTVKYILLGLAAAVPVLFVVVILLSMSDAVFSNYMTDLLIHLRIGDLFMILFSLVCAFFGAYCMLSSLCRRPVKEACPDRRCLNPIPAVVVTLLVCIIYLLFCGIQIIYLFAGQGQLPEGYTYAGYARQGFFELLFVCLINLGMAVCCTAFFRESRILKGLLSLICGCTYIMLASSACRMMMYVDSYGLTFLRFLVFWALIVIAVLMTGVTAHLFLQDFPLFRFGVAVVTVCYIGLAFSHPDYYIAKYNLDRYFSTVREEPGQSEEDRWIDIYYLSTLSADAVPAILEPETFRQIQAELLPEEQANIRYYLERMRERTRFQGMRQANASRVTAGLFLKKSTY